MFKLGNILPHRLTYSLYALCVACNMASASKSSSTNSPNQGGQECPYLQNFVWRKTYLSEHKYRNLVALTCFDSLAIIVTVLLNALVIFAVKTKRLLQSNSNILLACLAGSDLFAGMVGLPIAVAVNVNRAFAIGPFCALETVHFITLYGPSFVSLGLLVLISVDRYIAIKDALRYQVIVTKQLIKRGVFVAWAIGVYMTIQETVLAVTVKKAAKMYSVYWTVGSVSASLIGLICISGICYCYVYIFSEVRRQKKRLQTEQLSREEAKRVKKDNKAIYTLGIILGVLVITYMPAIILLIVGATSLFNNMSTGITLICISWASTSVLLRSVFNPIIYCWRNENIRRAFLEIFHIRQPENRAPDIQMVDMQHNRLGSQPSFRDTLSTAERKQEPVLLSIRRLKRDEIVHVEEMGN